MAKILVVDHDARNLRLAAAVLENAGHEVSCAADGTAGIEAALALAPALIFMDVRMPDMDGIAALERLRAEPQCASIKVVALTALAMNGDRERLLAAGFDGYLEKPIRYKEFVASVAALLQGAGE